MIIVIEYYFTCIKDLVRYVMIVPSDPNEITNKFAITSTKIHHRIEFLSHRTVI